MITRSLSSENLPYYRYGNKKPFEPEPYPTKYDSNSKHEESEDEDLINYEINSSFFEEVIKKPDIPEKYPVNGAYPVNLEYYNDDEESDSIEGMISYELSYNDFCDINSGKCSI